MCRSAILALAVLAILPLASGPADGAKTFEMKTRVEDFVTTRWTLECPDGSKIDFARLNITEQGWEEILDCIRDIEAANGLSLKSKTKVKNSVVVMDRIDATVEMTEQQAQKLCDIVEEHRLPSVARARSRPRIETVTVDFAITSMVVNCGDGVVIDLLKADLDAQKLQQVIQLIQQIEAQAGTSVRSTSELDGEDRVHTVAFLTAQQKEQLLQLLASNQVAVPPELEVFEARMTVKVKIDGEKTKATLEGPVILQRPPFVSTPDPIPVEIVALDLVSVDPLPLGPIHIRLNPSVQSQGQLGSPSGRKLKTQLQADLFLELELPDQAFTGTHSLPGKLRGKLRFPQAAGGRSMEVEGIKVFGAEPNIATMKVKRFELIFPARRQVFLDEQLGR